MEVYFRTSKGSVFSKTYKAPEEASKDIEKETVVWKEWV